MLVSLAGVSQSARILKPKIYERVVKPNTTVKVQTIENGVVSETRNTVLKDLQIPVISKTVVTYGKEISVIDSITYSRVKLNSQLAGSIEEFKIIPELHLEIKGNTTESYSIVFSTLYPFRYNFEHKKFNSSLGFFLSLESETTTTNISEPVYIEIVSNDVTSIIPDHLKIPHINMPSTMVQLVAEQVSDSVEVKVITTANPVGFTTYLKVIPSLEIISNKSTVQGYGIQKIPVIIRFIGSNSTEAVEVSFSIEKGTVEPTSMQVSYNKPSTIFILSEGTGVAELSAVTHNQQSNKISFTYTFPWPFLLFSMLGGLIGGLIKHFFNSGEKKFPVKPVIGGIFIGFIVAVAYYFLGINLIGISLSAGLNEIAVLGLSALGAYFGISVSPNPPK